MGYKKLVISIEEARRLISDYNWNRSTDISEYIEYLHNLGLRPYSKDIRPSLAKGIGDTNMNHFAFKPKYDSMRYLIVSKKRFVLTKIKYGL
jgi:hypothetical protein